MGSPDLADRLDALAAEVEPPRCTTPAYGVPGHAHCAACCYGTGYVLTCREDEQALQTATAMRSLARVLRSSAEVILPPVEEALTATGEASTVPSMTSTTDQDEAATERPEDEDPEERAAEQRLAHEDWYRGDR